MKTIKKPGDNLGGLLKIWAIPTSDFYLEGSKVTLITQANIYDLYCTPDSMRLQELADKSKSGLLYNIIITGSIPNDNEELNEAIQYITPRKWAIIFIDSNGKFKLAGTPMEPLRFESELNSGENTADYAGCKFSFQGKTKSCSIFISDPFAA